MDEKTSHVVMLDGAVVPPERAVVSVYDRGFLYGDSVFETMRCYDRVPFALREHVARLFGSAARVYIEVPVSQEEMAREILSAVACCELRRATVRVHVTRGHGPLSLDSGTAKEPLRVVLVEPLSLPSLLEYQYGVGVVLAKTERTADNTSAAGAKVANYLVSLLALREAHSRGAREAIIVDGHGRVLEGASSNVFVVSSGVVLTPPESEGILPGITRSFVLAACASLAIPTRITTLAPGDLLAADEVFLSSTLREILPVVAVDGQSIGNGRVGGVCRAIHRRFRELGNLDAQMPWEPQTA